MTESDRSRTFVVIPSTRVAYFTDTMAEEDAAKEAIREARLSELAEYQGVPVPGAWLGNYFRTGRLVTAAK